MSDDVKLSPAQAAYAEAMRSAGRQGIRAHVLFARVTEAVHDALEERIRALDVRTIVRDRQWEVTTYERQRGRHWHGMGDTLTEALDDLERLQKAYPDGC